jgi:hypothetical protein
MSTIKEVTIDKDNIYKTDDNITIIGKLKKEWIKTPKQLGSKKLKVIDEFTTQCNCGKHFTTLYILEKDYFTMHCESKGWAWLKQPANKSLLYELKIDINNITK